MTKKQVPLIYANLSGRLGALLLDGLIFAPLVVLDLWLDRQFRTYFFASALPQFALAIAYSVYFHARWGQTLGKMAAGIRVVSSDGSPISLKQALLRDLINVVLGVMTLTVYYGAAMSISPEDFTNLLPRKRYQQISEVSRPWRWTTWVQNIWTFGELAVVLFDKKRRAPHDFVAGTVVVQVSRSKNTLEVPATLP